MAPHLPRKDFFRELISYAGNKLWSQGHARSSHWNTCDNGEYENACNTDFEDIIRASILRNICIQPRRNKFQTQIGEFQFPHTHTEKKTVSNRCLCECISLIIWKF